MPTSDALIGHTGLQYPPCTKHSPTQDAEQTLLIASKKGNSKAFGDLLMHYERKLKNLAFGIARNPEDTQEIVQNSLLKAILHLNGFRGDSQFSSWLMSITKNEALMLVRRRNHDRVRTFSSAPDDDRAFEFEVPDSRYTPEQIVLQEELKQILTRAIDRLKPRYRIVLQLRYSEDLSTREVANLLGITLSTVKIRLRRARLELIHQVGGRLRQIPALH